MNGEVISYDLVFTSFKWLIFYLDLMLLVFLFLLNMLDGELRKILNRIKEGFK